jgi:multimeric flavodoxin WrbA
VNRLSEIKILGIACSPRKNGNSTLLLDEALKSAEEEGATVEKIDISKLKIEWCTACEACKANGECNINDDMQNLYPKLVSANGVIMSTPVYTYTVSAQAKTFLDRCYALRYRGFTPRKIINKVCGAIAVANNRGSLTAVSAINTALSGFGFIPISLGATGHANKPGEIVPQEKAMNDANILGKKIYNAAKAFST